MANERDGTEPTPLGRVAMKQRGLEKRRGATKFHATTAEKLRKLQRHPEGQAFVGATMHLVRRQLEGLDPQTPTEDRLRRAIEGLGEDRRVLEAIAARYAKLDPDEVVRAVSPHYLHRSLQLPVFEEELVATIGDAVRGHPDREPGPCVHLCCDGGDDRPPVPDPFDYGLTFAHLYCVDESNPEWPGSDEPYVVFAGITEAMVEAGTSAWSVHSDTYGDVDDGDRRPSSGDAGLMVYGQVAPKPIASPFLVVATCMEHDDGEPSEVSAGLRTSLTTVATTAAGIGGPAGWIVAGAAAIGVGITFLYDLWAADDTIGEVQRIALTETMAESLTNDVNPRLLDPLHFDGGSDDGIYDVYVKLERS